MLQRVAGDIMAVEKLGNIMVSTSESKDEFDVEMINSEITGSTQMTLQAYLFKTLASLTSEEESCRKKLVENKKI